MGKSFHFFLFLGTEGYFRLAVYYIRKNLEEWTFCFRVQGIYYFSTGAIYLMPLNHIICQNYISSAGTFTQFFPHSTHKEYQMNGSSIKAFVVCLWVHLVVFVLWQIYTTPLLCPAPSCLLWLISSWLYITHFF